MGLRHFRKSQRGRIEFQHAQLQGNDYVLPFYFETLLETCKFEDRQRIDLDPEEAKEELYIELRENVEDFFGCHVEFTELIPDYLHPEDLRELEEAFARKERDFSRRVTASRPKTYNQRRTVKPSAIRLWNWTSSSGLKALSSRFTTWLN